MGEYMMSLESWIYVANSAVSTGSDRVYESEAPFGWEHTLAKLRLEEPDLNFKTFTSYSEISAKVRDYGKRGMSLNLLDRGVMFGFFIVAAVIFVVYFIVALYQSV